MRPGPEGGGLLVSDAVPSGIAGASPGVGEHEPGETGGLAIQEPDRAGDLFVTRREGEYLGQIIDHERYAVRRIWSSVSVGNVGCGTRTPVSTKPSRS